MNFLQQIYQPIYISLFELQYIDKPIGSQRNKNVPVTKHRHANPF